MPFGSIIERIKEERKMFELRNILIYLYLGLQHLIHGRFKQAGPNFTGAFLRSYERIRDPFSANIVECNFCQWRGSKFRTYVSTVSTRENAVCPKCLSLERHREFLGIYNSVEPCLDKPKIRLLDIAPTKAFGDYCRAKGNVEYLSIDLKSQLAMRHMDLQNLELESNSFDCVVCYHVLDYLEDDSKGMSEIYRVLHTDGVAITQEGIDPSLKETLEWHKPIRDKEFRVRQYGPDFIDKWIAEGFITISVQTTTSDKSVFISTKSDNETATRLQNMVDTNVNLIRN